MVTLSGFTDPEGLFSRGLHYSGWRRTIRLFPTVQFVYSHHIKPQYVDEALRSAVKSGLRQPDVRSGSGSVLRQVMLRRRTMLVVR